VDDIVSTEVPLNVRNALDQFASGERNHQDDVFALLEQATSQPVAWADAAWPTVVPLLRHRDNRVRSIAGQILGRLGFGTVFWRSLRNGAGRRSRRRTPR
jgi:ABC-type transporter Mla subunit MlaD